MEGNNENKINKSSVNGDSDNYFMNIKELVINNEVEPKSMAWEAISLEVEKDNRIYHLKKYLKYSAYIAVPLVIMIYAIYNWQGEKKINESIPSSNIEIPTGDNENIKSDKENIDNSPLNELKNKRNIKQGLAPVKLKDSNAVASNVIGANIDTLIVNDKNNNVQSQLPDTNNIETNKNISVGKQKIQLKDSLLNYKQLFKNKK